MEDTEWVGDTSPLSRAAGSSGSTPSDTFSDDGNWSLPSRCHAQESPRPHLGSEFGVDECDDRVVMVL